MDLTGQKLGQYELLKRLGRGGMAEVYLTVQPVVERYVALKVLHRHLVDDEDFLERFQREAKSAGRLNHANIVRVIEYNRDKEDHYLVLDYIPGGTLRGYLEKKGILQPVEALDIMAQLTDAVAYAHQQGIIHRDIKPDNIMFTDETARQVMLTDFGLARLHDGPNMTHHGTVIGTAGYVSPEVLNGGTADERSDIYSLGIVLYQMLTGSTPYQASSPYGMMLKQLHDPLPLPREKNPNISPEMEALVLNALEKEPNDRFQSTYDFYLAVKQMRMALQSGSRVVSTGSASSDSIRMEKEKAPPLRKAERGSKLAGNMNGRPILAVGGGVFLAALVTVFILLLVPYIGEPSDIEPTETPAENSAMVETPPMSETPEILTPTATPEAAAEAPIPDEAGISVIRFEDNESVQAGNIRLQIDQILPAPEGSHYELLLMGQNLDMVLNLGELPVENNQIDFTYRTEENLLAHYHQVMINLASNDDSGEELTVLMGSLDNEYIKQLRALLINDHTKGFLPNVVQQSELASQQITMVQNALRANDLAEAKRYTEQLVNILEGENGMHYGDLNGDGEVENPGNGFGVQKYLRGIQAQTERVMSNAERTDAQEASANQLMALSEGSLTASDTSIRLALELLQVTAIDEETVALANQLEWYVLELLEGPDLDRESGGVVAAYKYGLRMAEVNLFPR